ncbi:hypothetical protein [Filibacter tadaridae]|uniref:hypothetical protein n=1 Tax=Filibacter tadaridae TaxID=2483811 RepID=UPI000F53E376|nr:hypothetical protein [Filibacter tadaridae]
MKKYLIPIGLALFITLGGTAIANEKNPADYIKNLMDTTVIPLLSDAEKSIQATSQGYENELSALVKDAHFQVSRELTSWNESELKRVNNELSAYYALQLAVIEDATEKEIRAGKLKITEQLNAYMAKEKAKIDAALNATTGEIKGVDSKKPIHIEPPVEEVEIEDGTDGEFVQDGSELMESEEPDTSPIIETSERDE